MPQPSWRLTLRIIAILSCLASFVWLVFKPGFDALLTLLASIAAFLGSFVTDSTHVDSLEHRNRRTTLEKVRNDWVKGVLEQSLHSAALIELGMEYKPEAVQYPWSTVLQRPDQPAQPLPPGTKTAEVFDQVNGELLILGAPGSGKTTMLLDLARDLIARAEQDETLPIPSVFNLSSWAEKRLPLAEWLIEELTFRYNVPKKISKLWVKDGNLLLLLDGLDEVKPEHQTACVEAINRFRQEHGLPVTVCSRIADYEARKSQLRLRGAIVLQPLTREQIEHYLVSAGEQLASVRALLKRDTALQELAESPLMISMMAIAYSRLSIAELVVLDTIGKRRRHLFDTYVHKMFKRPNRSERQWRKWTLRSAFRRWFKPYDQFPDESLYTPQQTIHWLSWLAWRMVEHNQTTFYLERMQPNWLLGLSKRLAYAIVTVLSAMLFGGLAVRLVDGLFNNSSPHQLFSGLFVGLIGLLALRMKEIKMVETLVWSWSNASKGLVLGLIIGLISELLFRPFIMVGDVRVVGPMVAVIIVSIPVLIGCLWGGMKMGVEIDKKTYPNQGIRRSAKNALFVMLAIGWPAGLIGGLSFGLFVGPVNGLFARLINGLFVGFLVAIFLVLIPGLVVGLQFGGMACIQHAALRIILYLNGSIPFRYVRFLDYCAERIFLRKVGGGYIFVHRLLMEYFAGLEGEV